MTSIIRHVCTIAGSCVVLALPRPYGSADTLDNLEECRSASTDNFSFKECVGLQHQASETLLASIENSWREYLESGQDTAETAASIAQSEPVRPESTGPELAANSNSDDARAPAESKTASDGSDKSSGGKLIEIVSDEPALATDSKTVINITNQALLESDFPALSRDNVADLSMAAQHQRFDILADLYRQYRDERCTWEGGLYGADRADVYITACNAWLNQERAKVISLQLSEKRASDAHGTFFSGFYIDDGDSGIFQSCDRRQEWRLTGDTGVLADIAARYGTIARDNLEMAYLEVRGDINAAAFDAGSISDLEVRSFNLLRAIEETDCSPTRNEETSKSTTTGESQATSDGVGSRLDDQSISNAVPGDITVDALGASGFLYGYFANWVSACAVEQNAVCMTQAESGYSGLGEWRLVVDRSLDRRWRVQLIPTVSDTTIGRAISITIDGAIVGSYPVSDAGTTVKAEVGIVLAQGNMASQLVNQMRNGQNLSINWSLPTEIGSELNFSLVGVTRALEFFDQSG